ncbi:hypothetical protein [Frankia sp. AvcI1]|uniref:hypothetical protein n=1 Tax=Frankia sp. AvcI1 TaxID=573496 RepID=UPI0006EC1408|nr:hypothetical protein [Frankia sp. AvcI1]
MSVHPAHDLALRDFLVLVSHQTVVFHPWAEEGVTAGRWEVDRRRVDPGLPRRAHRTGLVWAPPGARPLDPRRVTLTPTGLAVLHSALSMAA